MKLETRTDIEKLLCEQLELLAEKSKESNSSELQGLTTAMLDVSNYLVDNGFGMVNVDGELLEIGIPENFV